MADKTFNLQIISPTRVFLDEEGFFPSLQTPLVGEGKLRYLPQNLRDILHDNIHINAVGRVAFGVLGFALGVLAAIGHIAVAAAPPDGADVHF